MVRNQFGFRGMMVLGLVLLWGGMLGGSAMALDPTFVGTGMQCPNDIDNNPVDWSITGIKGPEDFDHNGDGDFNGVNGISDPNAVCMRVGVTDGYAKMPDGSNLYLFGFVNLTGVPENEIVDQRFHAHLPAPTIEVQEGQTLYLTETNLALVVRPDLFDPHTLHFHGFPHAMAIFDGVPENSIAVPGGQSFTYFYKLNDPGTYPYHCHVEPVEHIQMGMVGTIVVKAQDDTDTAHFAYDNAPNTRYDKAYSFLIDALDPDKHWNLENIQEGANLWHEYRPNYFTLNGRAYPDTILADDDTNMINANGYIAQTSSLIEAQAGDRILLRLNSLAFETHTLTIPGIKMHVVGEDARLLRGPGPDGKDLSYWKTTYSIAGGKTVDILLDTAGLEPGTYFLYGRELNSQSNLSREDRMNGVGDENRGGMMTEIHISAGI